MADQTLVGFDELLADQVILINKTTGKVIPFQFPPKIKSETKESNWEVEPTATFEPIKTYMSSNPRSLSLEFEYIASGSGPFEASKIAEYLRNIKEYFYKANIATDKKNIQYPVFSLKMYGIVPSAANFRLHNINISYSDQIVRSGDSAFPLHTKVAMSLELATTISIDGGEPQMDIGNLVPMDAKWF